MDRLGLRDYGDSWNTWYSIKARPGAVDAVAGDLARFNENEPPSRSIVPGEVSQLARLKSLPRWLGAFLVVLGLLAVGHALVLTVRRRTSDLAVVRVLGCTPGQTSRAVAWQATTLSAVGLVVGIPLGVLLGRVIWSQVASAYGIADDVLVSWLGVAAIVLGAFVLANAIAFLPGRRVARIRPATALRSE
jgi:ABC-type lipoprotein release transport system permease subunit